MQFPFNIAIAAVISAIHVLIFFKLRLPRKYKKGLRGYSVVVNVIFIVFLGSFSIFFKTSFHNQGIQFYYNGLATLYFVLAIPLVVALILLFRNFIMKADIYSIYLKYTVILGGITVLTGIAIVGYPLFMLAFYGFAP